MSTYLYTLRSQTVRAKDDTGISQGVLEIALFSFVTGHYGGWDGPSRHESACESLAEAAWDKLAVDGKVPYVVQGSKEDIDKLRKGERGFLVVYRDCTCRRWVDTNPFPAAASYGLLVKDGGRLAVRRAYVSEGDGADVSTSAMMLTATNGASGWVPITGMRVEVFDGTAQETMRQVALPNGDLVWVNLKDTEALKCVADDWAPSWDAKKQEEARNAERQRLHRALANAGTAKKVLVDKVGELQVQLAELECQIRQKDKECAELVDKLEAA